MCAVAAASIRARRQTSCVCLANARCQTEARELIRCEGGQRHRSGWLRPVTLKVRRTEIVPAAASANINFGGCSAYLVSVRIKSVQQTWLIQLDLGLDSRKRVLAYKKSRLDRAIVTPKPHHAPRRIIRTAVVWKINHGSALLFADQRQL
jgi:hypothetical protein